MKAAGAQNFPSRLHALKTELHVWLIRPESVTDAAVLESYREMLSAEERARYRKYRFDKDRHLYLVSHALVRSALSCYADVLPAAWEFSTSSSGKPEILAPVLPVLLRFSLSHTSGLAACLVALDSDCGVDVEVLSRQCDMQGIAARMFSAQERQQLARLDGDQYHEQFLYYWTLREAYGKALGSGLASAGSQCCFVEQAGGSYRISQSDGVPESGAWSFSVSRPTAEHVLALAARNGEYRDRQVVMHWL